MQLLDEDIQVVVHVLMVMEGLLQLVLLRQVQQLHDISQKQQQQQQQQRIPTTHAPTYANNRPL